MQSTVNKLENSQVELFVEVDGSVWENAQKVTFNKMKKELEVDGFRKGQVPEAIAKKHLKNENIMISAVEEVAQEALVSGVDQHNIVLVASPDLSVEAISDTAVKLKFLCTVAPEVTLGEYKDLGIEKEEVSVSDSEVDAELEKLREQHAELALKEGSLEKGDTAVFDFEGFKDDVAFEGGKADNHSLEIGSNQFIPGFEDKMIGMTAGEERNIDLVFPEEYHVEDLAGADVVFRVKLHEIKERIVPELDDEFAKDVDKEDVNSLDELKNHLRDEITSQKQLDAERELENEILTKVVDNASVEIPEVMITQEIERLYQDMKARIEQQGIPFDQFIAMTGQDESALRDNLKLDAERQVKLRLVLDEIAKVENLEVSDDEVENEYQELSTMYNMELDEVKKAIDVANLSYDLRIRKAYDLVKDSN